MRHHGQGRGLAVEAGALRCPLAYSGDQAALHSTYSNGLENTFCLNKQVQLIILGDKPGVHGTNPDRVKSLEGLDDRFSSDEYRLEHVLPIILPRDDRYVIGEIRVSDERPFFLSPIRRLLLLLNPALPDLPRYPMLDPLLAESCAHPLVNEAPKLRFEPKKAVVGGIGPLESGLLRIYFAIPGDELSRQGGWA